MPRPKPEIGKKLFSFRMNDALKERLALYAYVKADSISHILEKATVEYMRRNPLDHMEEQHLRSIIKKQLLQDTLEDPTLSDKVKAAASKNLDLYSPDIEKFISDFKTLPEIFDESKLDFKMTTLAPKAKPASKKKK